MKNIIFVSVVLTLLASCALMPEKSVTPDTMQKPETKMDSTMMMDDKMMSGSWTPEEMDAMSGEHMVDDKKMMDDTMMKKDDSNMMKPSGYMAYDAAKVDAALASGQKVALFFHATWCPSCKALDKAINSSLSSIPADTLIVKVDYDTSTDLRKKYRVVGQHTTVILNADGTEKSKKLGARTVAEVLN